MNQINSTIRDNNIEHSSLDLDLVPWYSGVTLENDGKQVIVMQRGNGNYIDLGKADDYDIHNLVVAGVPLKEVSTYFFEPHTPESEHARVFQAVNALSKVTKKIKS